MYTFLTISIFVMISIILLTSCSILDRGSKKIKNLRDFTAQIVEDNITYDGTEKQVTVALYEGNNLVDTVSGNTTHPDLEIRYYNNIDAGDATVYVCANETTTKYIGGISVSFVISPVVSVTVNDADSLRKISSSGNYLEVKLGEDLTIPKNNSLNVHSKTTLNLNGKKLHTEGPLIINGCVSFENDSALYLHDEVRIKGNNSISINGTNATIYSDMPLELPTTYEGLDVYVRTRLKISLEKYLYDYTGEEISPEVISDFDEGEYDVRYENNIDVGRATAVVTAKPDSKYVFGTWQEYFTISTVAKIAYNDAMLAEIMQDKNFTVITLEGEFSDVVIPEGYNVTANDITISGNLTINGTLHVSQYKRMSVSGQTTINGTFTNNGDAIFTELQNNGTINNYEKFTLNSKFQNDATLLNGGWGEIYCNDDYASGASSTFTNNGLVYYESTFENKGEMNNKGNIYFFAKENITASNKIINDGCIYSDISLTDMIANSYKGKSVVRCEITDEYISLYSTEFYYDGKAKAPMPKFVSGLGALTVDSNDYYVTRRYSDSESSSYATTKPGVVNMTISFKKDSKSYTGSIVLQYEIFRGIYTITQDSDFNTVFEDENYATALISGNFSTNKDLLIPDYSELRISENGGLVYTGQMQVFGMVNNYGNLAFAKTGFTQIVVEEGGCINNAGNVFFNESSQENVISGDGEIYVRKEIQQSNIKDFPDMVPYDTLDNAGVRPVFRVVMDELELVLQEDYIAEYTNNKTINSSAHVTVRAKDFSKYIYGYVGKYFAIERGTITVKSYDNMIKALEKKTNDICNFSTIYLGNDMVKAIGAITSSQSETITIPKDTVLDCGQYVLDLRIKEGQKGKYEIKNYGTILVKKVFPNINYKYNTTYGGEIIGEADNIEDLVSLAEMCSKIDITGNIPAYGTDTIRPTKCNLVIDLHGYTVGVVLLYCQYYSLKITSTDRRGTITVKISYVNTQITFDNLRLPYYYDYNESSRYVTITNCTF